MTAPGGRTRPSWDTVRWQERRERERAEHLHAARVGPTVACVLCGLRTAPADLFTGRCRQCVPAAEQYDLPTSTPGRRLDYWRVSGRPITTEEPR